MTDGVKDERTPFVMDPDLRRPGCVILQAALGGNTSAAKQFPTESWLLAPTPGMRVFMASSEQLARFVAEVRIRDAKGEFAR